MKHPLYNAQERLEMREIDCTITAYRKLNLATLAFIREMDRTIRGLFEL